MFEKELPARPNLAQYKKQAKELHHEYTLGIPDALARIKRNHHRFHKLTEAELRITPTSLTDAQLVLAREHGFISWPKFAAHIETLRIIDSVANLTDPVSAFLEVACAPRHASHNSGTLEHAEAILARYPHVATSNIYTAAILADETAVRSFLARDPQSASKKGGHYDADPLTHLCFSRYLRLDPSRSEAFVRTAQVLLDAGASVNTGWIEMIDQPTPRPILESAIYGAAAVAQHVELTRLLLANGADPNDDETPYHVPETYDNTILQLMLHSGKLTAKSLSWIGVRKADWHDEAGMKMVLEYGANTNIDTIWGVNVLHHALRRDNDIAVIRMLLDYGADPSLVSTTIGFSATAIAAHRGRRDVLELFEERGIPIVLDPPHQLIAACAKADRKAIASLTSKDPQLVPRLLVHGGTLLAIFAGVGNVEGVRCLLDLGIPVTASFAEGDGYFELAKNSTALHNAAWRARYPVVAELIARGAPINALDGQGRTALQLAVRACIDSHWMRRRSPDSVAALLDAGATVSGIDLPTGYEAIDNLLLPLATKAMPN